MYYPQLPVGAFIAAALVLFPLPSYWRSKNVATLSLILWLFLMNLIYGLNSLVWADNASPRWLVWCDITTKLMIGASHAIPAAAMCVCKHLELVASGRVVRLTHDDQRRRKFLELFMCFGLPIILMALHYIVQGHRFDIMEDIGCQPATYYSIPGVFIVWFPPLLFSFITLIYSSFALYYFFRQRLTFSAVLSASSSSLSTSRYLRLIAMSLILIVFGSTLTSLIMYENIALGLRPYTSWKDVHSNFSRVDSYRLFEVALGGEGVLRMVWCSWWAMPASALIFFVFFAFGEESLKDMKAGFVWVTSKLGIRSKKKDAEKSGMPFSSVTNSPGSKKAPKHIIVHKLSTGDVCSDLKDDKALPSYSPSPKITSSYHFTSSSASTLATPTSTSSLTKGKPSLTFEDCQEDVESGVITVSLHDSAPSEDDITSSDPHHPTLPQFSAPYQSRFIEGPMSSPSVNRIHHSPRPTSSTHGFDDDEGEDAGARISISDPHPASRPSTPPSPSYSFVISSSPLSPTDMVNTIEDGMRREGDMV